MSEQDWTGDALILGIDVIGYTRFAEVDQVRIVKTVDRVLVSAAETAKIEVLGHHWLDAGDGGYHVIRGDVRSALSVCEAFVRGLTEELDPWQDDKRFGCRYAIHCGDVKRSSGQMGSKFTGDAINNCARLLGGMSKDYTGQVVCSGTYKDRLCKFGTEIEELFQRLADVTDKHGDVHQVFNIRRIPGLGVTVEAKDLHSPG